MSHTDTAEYCEAHATRILTDLELSSVRKSFLLLLHSFTHPYDSAQAHAYMQNAADLSVLCGFGVGVMDQIFMLAYEECESRGWLNNDLKA